MPGYFVTIGPMCLGRNLLLGMFIILAACAEVEPTEQVAKVAVSPTSGATTVVPVPPTRPAKSPTVAAPAPPTAVATTEFYVIGNLIPTFYPASDERIRYIGRFDFTDPLRPAFDWSGVSVEFVFLGTSVTLHLEDGRNLYNVTIDGHKQILATDVTQSTYIVAEELKPGEHHLRLTKRTEAYVGAAVFSGIDVTGVLLQAPPARERKIEFIGDSITAGYGNEGTEPECWFTPDTENMDLSYAAIVAEQLDADYASIALSGLGVVRNMRDERASSPQTAIDYIDRTLAMNPTVKWPAERSVPAAVVINLGTNDFSSRPFPDEQDFVEAYLELLTSVHIRYPQAHLFAVAGPLMLQPAPRLIEQAVIEFHRSEEGVLATYVLIEDNLERSAADFGCDWHPNVSGHRKIADQLMPVIARELGWQTTN